MKKLLIALVVIVFGAFGWAQNNSNQSNQQVASSDINKELNTSTQIIKEMTGPNATAGIPDAILTNAQCIAVIPNLIQGGFIVGARHGSGVATCRTSDGQWSPPAPLSLTGASFGAQIGVQAIDLVMMAMNQQGVKALRSGHFKVGAGASAAAGPVGRQASASAGWKAAILTYSRTNGIYAGAILKGAEIQQDDSATEKLYGRDVKFGNILTGQVNSPNDAQAHEFLMAIQNARQSAQAQ